MFLKNDDNQTVKLTKMIFYSEIHGKIKEIEEYLNIIPPNSDPRKNRFNFGQRLPKVSNFRKNSRTK